MIVEQVTGREIAHGSTYIPGINGTGANRVIPVTVLADPTGPPFKNGTAVITTSVTGFYYDATFGYIGRRHRHREAPLGATCLR